MENIPPSSSPPQGIGAPELELEGCSPSVKSILLFLQTISYDIKCGVYFFLKINISDFVSSSPLRAY